MSTPLFPEVVIPQDSDGLAEGSTNRYFTEQRVNETQKVIDNTTIANAAQSTANGADSKANANTASIAALTTTQVSIDTRVAALEGSELVDQTFSNEETNLKGAQPLSPPASPGDGDRHVELYTNYQTSWEYDGAGSTWIERLSTPITSYADWVRTAADVDAADNEKILCLSVSPITVTLPAGVDGHSVTISRRGVADVTVVPQSGETVEDQADNVTFGASGNGRRTEFIFDAGTSNWIATETANAT